MKYYIDFGKDTYMYRNDSTGTECPMTSKDASDAMRPSTDPDDNTPMQLDVREYSSVHEAIEDAMEVIFNPRYPDISAFTIRDASSQRKMFTATNIAI
jgi:hypothetical protein